MPHVVCCHQRCYRFPLQVIKHRSEVDSLGEVAVEGFHLVAPQLHSLPGLHQLDPGRRGLEPLESVHADQILHKLLELRVHERAAPRATARHCQLLDPPRVRAHNRVRCDVNRPSTAVQHHERVAHLHALALGFARHARCLWLERKLQIVGIETRDHACFHRCFPHQPLRFVLPDRRHRHHPLNLLHLDRRNQLALVDFFHRFLPHKAKSFRDDSKEGHALLVQSCC
mmetsp:Transcript_13370/g.31326  ORF Transcript_13370/g.31326 Transcript_13370/m.31326 type:complete len:227 (+) Transcript_13370:967-1647(+)